MYVLMSNIGRDGIGGATHMLSFVLHVSSLRRILSPIVLTGVLH